MVSTWLDLTQIETLQNGHAGRKEGSVDRPAGNSRSLDGQKVDPNKEDARFHQP